VFTGNRGIIHDPTTRTLLNRRWTSKAWLVCVREFKGRRRTVMLRSRAVTSAERVRRQGYVRRSARNLLCLALHTLRVPAHVISRIYG